MLAECARRGRRTTNSDPAPFAFAGRRDLSAVELDQVSNKSETQPQPAVATRAGAVGLPESVEDMREELG